MISYYDPGTSGLSDKRVLMKRTIIVLLLFLCILITAQSQRSVQNASPKDSTLTGASAVKAPIEEPMLVPIDEASVGKVFSEKKGKVLLVNLWATWCGPCVREFPELVKLQKDYLGKGLQVLLVSIDDPRITETKVKPFLEKQKVTFPSYIKKTNNDALFFAAVGKGFGNAIPTTFVYNRQGRQVGTFVGVRDYKAFEEVIKPLLNEAVEKSSQGKP